MTVSDGWGGAWLDSSSQLNNNGTLLHHPPPLFWGVMSCNAGTPTDGDTRNAVEEIASNDISHNYYHASCCWEGGEHLTQYFTGRVRTDKTKQSN